MDSGCILIFFKNPQTHEKLVCLKMKNHITKEEKEGIMKKNYKLSLISPITCAGKQQIRFNIKNTRAESAQTQGLKYPASIHNLGLMDMQM